MSTIIEPTFIVPNQIIEITRGTKQAPEHYKSRIEDVNGDTMLLAMPMSKGYPIISANGEVFLAKIITDGNVYQFKCRYIDKKHIPIPVWVVSLPYDIKKVQLRDFVRIDASLETTLQVLAEEETSNQEATDEIHTVTKDISGGGVLVVSKEPIPLGKKVFVSIHIPEFGLLETYGQVIRLSQPAMDQELYWIGIKFSSITERQRSGIVQFVFKKQLERRKKGF